MRLLDRYVIDSAFARGGMAIIYRGVDERFQREVCVKLLRTQVEVGDREVYHATYTHFLQEASLLSKLQHPNTLKIFDFGHVRVPGPEEECPFQVSEFIGGPNLEELVRKEGKLPARFVLDVIEPICHALTEAHGHGIIHRDLKPSNILFAEIAGKRIPKLADFGIAKTQLVKRNELDSTITETVSKIALFSPRWAAPEQISSYSDGPETDVFGLAMVTAFMLGGRPPFAERDVNATLKERKSSDEPVAAAIRGLGLPAHVERFLTSVLVIDKKRRPKTALLFFSLLRSAIAAETAESIAPPPISPPLPPAAPLSTDARSTLQTELDAERGPDTPVVVVPHVAPRDAHASGAPPPHRMLYVQDRAEISFPQRTREGREAREEPLIRVRVSVLPNDHVHVKGLNCFVARDGQGPTAALTVRASETITCISAQGVWLGRIVCVLPTNLANGLGFALDEGPLLVPYSEGTKSIALRVPDSVEWLIVTQR